MKILILHPNFPGQFRHIATDLASSGHEVVFLCQTHYGRKIDGVNLLTLKGKYGHKELESRNLDLIKRNQFLAHQFREGLSKLKTENWNPDIVISHSGWGCGFFVKEVWPKCFFVSYLEWWFNPCSDFFSYDEQNTEVNLTRKSTKKNWPRNASLALELVSADQIVSPTQWQRSQLPTSLAKDCQVIFDGIELEIYKTNAKNKSITPKITYGTRGMDPLRAFPQFIRSLPILLKNVNAKVEIAGNINTFYGNPPKGFPNWKEWADEYIGQNQLEESIIWKGFMPPNVYKKWLQSSWCHVYLTHPFVASWSLVEALACGCPIVVSDVETTKEFCRGMDGIQLVDHRKPEDIARKIEWLINNSLGPYTRSDCLQRYNVGESIRQWKEALGLELSTVG